jgi:L-ascorbate metabolism protein UlaG (beta-lactamase superfamily)
MIEYNKYTKIYNMNINWYGQTCFKISASKTKEGQINIIIDPPAKGSGLRGPKLEADILLSTDLKEKIPTGNYFPITGPGEYDIKEIFIQGVKSDGATIYKIEAEDMKLCHLGKTTQKELSSEQVELIGEVDILFLPIDSDPKAAVKMMSQIEPKVIIPMNYKSIEGFLKTLGIKSLEKSSKFSIKAKDLPKEEVKIIALEA